MTEANRALAKVDGGNVSVIGVDSKLPEFLPLWVAGAGGALLSEDGKTAQLDSPEAVEALKWAVGIYDDQGGFSAVKAFRDSADFFGEGNQFATNTLGAMPMEQWYINVLNDVSPDAPLAFDTVRATRASPRVRGRLGVGHPLGQPEPRGRVPLGAGDDLDGCLEGRRRRPPRLREDEGKPFTGILTGNSDADEQIRGHGDVRRRAVGPPSPRCTRRTTTPSRCPRIPPTPSSSRRCRMP